MGLVGDVGHCEVHVFAHRQIDGVAALVGVHDVCFVVQTCRVLLCGVEREIYVVCIVAEDGREVGAQGIGHGAVTFLVENAIQFRRQVRDESQLVSEFVFLAAIAQVFIDGETAREYERQGCHEGQTNVFPPSTHASLFWFWLKKGGGIPGRHPSPLTIYIK